MIAPSSAGRSTDTARTAWKPALQSGPAGSRLWARLLAEAMLLPDRVHPRRKVAGVNALGCARAKAGGVTLTWFKPPYWGRSRTYPHNGCNRFPLAPDLAPMRGPASPLRRVPPIARPFLPPLCRDLLKPPLAPPLRCPPLRGLPPLRAALRAATLDPRGTWVPLGDGRPAGGHGPAADAAWRGLRRGLAIPRPAVIPTHFVVGIHGWAPGGTRSSRLSSRSGLRSPCASGVALGVKIGGVHHASSVVLRGDQSACGGFCRALWPCGLRVGARAS